MGALSIWHWLIVLAIVLVIFGTKRLRNIGADLGGSIKGFREATRDVDNDDALSPPRRQRKRRER